MADKKIEKKRMKMIRDLETLSGKFFRYQREGKKEKMHAVDAEATALSAALLAFDEVYPPEEDYKYGRLLAIYVPYPKKFHPDKYITQEEKRAKEREEALARKDYNNENNLKSVAAAVAEIFVQAFFGFKWKTEPTGETGNLSVKFYIDRDILRFYSGDRLSTNDRIIKLRNHNIYACTNDSEFDIFLDRLRPHLKKASKEAFDKKFAELAKTITFKTEIVDAQYTDYLKKENPNYPCLQMTLNYTYPAPPPKPMEPPKPAVPVQATTHPPVQKQTVQAPAKPTVSADTGPIPIVINPYTQKTTTAPATSAASAPVKDPNLPKIPGGNRYAGHDALIGRIAKDIVDDVFDNCKPVQWYAVPSKAWVLRLMVSLRISNNDIYVSSSKGNSKSYNFVKYNMRSIPDINMFAFAINPFIEYYAKKRAEESFGRDSFRTRYTLTFKLEKLTHFGDTEHRPSFELNQYLLPSRSLNSW